MNYAQLLYLKNSPYSSTPGKVLHTSAAMEKQAEIEQQFAQAYRKQGLSEQDFLPDGQSIEIEKLLRYLEIPAHKHNFLELVCVLGGTCTQTIENRELNHNCGDLVIIPPGILHKLTASPDCVCLTAKMRTSAFLENFSGLLLRNSLLSSYFTQSLKYAYYRCALTLHAGKDSFFQDMMLAMVQQQEEHRIYHEEIIQYLWQALFTYLLQNYQDTAEFLVDEQKYHPKALPVLNYIFDNYQTITLEATAHHFHFSPSYVSTKIHEWTGKTFSHLLREYKLQHAAELLTHTDKKLDEICDEIGYKDTVHFIRAFKTAYHQTPNQYRKGQMK